MPDLQFPERGPPTERSDCCQGDGRYTSFNLFAATDQLRESMPEFPQIRYQNNYNKW